MCSTRQLAVEEEEPQGEENDDGILMMAATSIEETLTRSQAHHQQSLFLEIRFLLLLRSLRCLSLKVPIRPRRREDGMKSTQKKETLSGYRRQIYLFTAHALFTLTNQGANPRTLSIIISILFLLHLRLL